MRLPTILLAVTSVLLLSLNGKGLAIAQVLDQVGEIETNKLSPEHAHFFSVKCAREFMLTTKALAGDGGESRETFFFDSTADNGGAFVGRVLRSGGLADKSGQILELNTVATPSQIYETLSRFSAEDRTANPIEPWLWKNKLAVVSLAVRNGTKVAKWPNYGALGKQSSNQPINVVIVFDRTGAAEIAGIFWDWEYSDVGMATTFLTGKVLESGISLLTGKGVFRSIRESELSRCVVFSLHTHFSLHGEQGREILLFLTGAAASHFALRKTEPDLPGDWWSTASFSNIDNELRWKSQILTNDQRASVVEEIRKRIKEAEAIYESNKKEYIYHKYKSEEYARFLSIIESQKSILLHDNSPSSMPEGSNAQSVESVAGNRSNEPSEQQLAEKLTKEVVKLSLEQASNEKAVKEWVDTRKANAIRNNPKIPVEQRGIITTIEQSLEEESKSIVAGSRVTKALLIGLDVWEAIDRESDLDEIRKFAEKGDAYSAWKKTVVVSMSAGSDPLPAGIASAASALSPFIAEALAEATVDICVPLGNQIAWWMWDNGYSPVPPRFAKDEFKNGVRRPVEADVPSPVPVVPAVPNGTPTPGRPGEQELAVTPPSVVPPTALEVESQPNPEALGDVPRLAQPPFVPIVTPVPLPPPIYANRK